MSTIPTADQLTTTTFEITTFGTLHQDPPLGDAITVDLTTALRNPPEDPAVREQMIQSTGLDQHVLDYVLATPGARDIADRTVRRALAQHAALPGETVRIHVYCRGGRHRSVSVGREVGRRLQALGAAVTVTHRHVHLPVAETSR
ncbi:RNase adapter RapZ [Kitasatospora sp. NPDC094016]|uniref:RapZ C-terminal domain-containing protein n=1 Tax=Kitasatospora sp. NPDC094016 TaxID=3154986 RepID=UPI00331A9C62